MPEIQQIDVSDVLGRLPNLTGSDAITLNEGGIDLLICCAGFEDRATAILDDLDSRTVKSAIVVTYPTNQDENRAALDSFVQRLASVDLTAIEYDTSMFLSRIRDKLKSRVTNNRPRIVVDISGMSSYVLHRVLAAILDLCPEAALVVFYAEAGEYSPSQTEWANFYDSIDDPSDRLMMAERYEETWFQSRGMEKTYESDVFPGFNPEPLATRIIAIPSFSLQRMKSMLAFAESRYSVPQGAVHWFLGKPPNAQKNGWRFDALASLYNVQDNAIALCTLDYRKVVQELDAIWTDVGMDSHLLIADMGSKMQHLGVYLFLRMHADCGLILCEPECFIANRYTVGIGDKWIANFGNVAGLNEILGSCGESKFVW